MPVMDKSNKHISRYYINKTFIMQNCININGIHKLILNPISISVYIPINLYSSIDVNKFLLFKIIFNKTFLNKQNSIIN